MMMNFSRLDSNNLSILETCASSSIRRDCLPYGGVYSLPASVKEFIVDVLKRVLCGNGLI
jgi:hypothetical protein